MKLKKYLSKIIALSMGLCMMTGYNPAYADSAINLRVTPNNSEINLRVTPNNSENYIALDWNAPDNTNPYSYMIYSKESSESEFQSIPAKDNVKVLNVYPTLGNNLKSWMEDPNEESENGYGKGLISVDEVDILDFNNAPDSYLKDSDGNYKYDVVFLGAWDGNNEEYLNETSTVSLKAFMEAGRGVLAGHDTYCFYNELNVTGAPQLEKYGNTEVRIAKKGILTNYPWVIGQLNDELTIPLSHSNCQYAGGDVWLQYTENTMSDDPLVTSYQGKMCTNNFYLTTWNNCAMIQTGHSKGEATADEQKILANTLFYLAQVTDKTSWNDHKGQDVAGPTTPDINSVSYDVYHNKIDVTFNSSTDNGTTYDYYVEATNTKTHEKTKSDIKSGTVTTGLKGYSILVDNNPDSIPSTDITTTENFASVNLTNIAEGDLYVHVAAVDNAGNLSQVSTYRYAYPTLMLTPSTTESTNGPVKITAQAASENSTIVKIQTPDGNYVDGDTAYYDADQNGFYTFVAIDNLGLRVTKTIGIFNITDNKVILNVEPERDYVHLYETISAYLTIDNIKEIASEDVRIKYDSSKLQYLGMEEVEGVKIVQSEENANELRVVLESKDKENIVNAKKQLLKLNFKGISFGQALIDVTAGKVYSTSCVEKTLLDSQCGETTLNVIDYADVNKDGQFTLLDLAIDARYYGLNPSDYPQYNTDIVENGSIDDDDLLQIGRYMMENPNYRF